ncbi:Hypothetical protein Tpal_65 [Trichococcus palustris]|uniref:Uncharacterized protein n=1 Tax=Trichococcus palustris TaxID=140314 RepID=A0A143Y5H3_9LACT|nr:hypothetical protein [Trichococcus palustris]CZQ80345.1 Hypothetical protein Tpal_65 [Trichococcus palustris]SFK64773.1 hypothetical protein SAMN04488076_102227 [Trichococcus palustris]
MEKKGNPSRIMLLTLAGACSFFVAGLAAGWILLYFEFPLALIAEGFIGGALFWIFIRERFNLFKVVVATILADTFSFFISLYVVFMLGIMLPGPRMVGYMVMGLVMGLIFGGILGGIRGILIFSAIGAVGFLIGGALFDTANVWSGPFVDGVNAIFGPMGWTVIVPGLTGIFPGAAMGLAMGVFWKKR